MLDDQKTNRVEAANREHHGPLVPHAADPRHCQLIETIPNKWLKHVITD